MIAVIFGGFGLIIGSFLNVLILREGTRDLGGRSECMRCKEQLTWRDLIPVFSWLVLRGRCRHCKAHISMQYPLVEAGTAALFILIGMSPLMLFQAVVACVFVSLLIAITVYDLQHLLIPDRWSYGFGVLALLYALLQTPQEGLLLLIFAGPACALPLAALWFVSKGRWMGLGDAKLCLGIGWLLGPVMGLYAVLGAFIIGAVVSVCILIPLSHVQTFLRRRGITVLSSGSQTFTMKSEIPFGPFLIASCLILWFLSVYGVTLPLLI